MIKVALVASNGEVVSVVSPAMDDMYLDGTVYNGLTARHVDPANATDVVLSDWYWHTVDGVFYTDKPAKPGSYYAFTNYTWVFDNDEFFNIVRLHRDDKIAASDWTQLVDSPLTAAQKAEWVTYRQTLRDIPATYASATSLDDITWPTEPE